MPRSTTPKTTADSTPMEKVTAQVAERKNVISKAFDTFVKLPNKQNLEALQVAIVSGADVEFDAVLAEYRKQFALSNFE